MTSKDVNNLKESRWVKILVIILTVVCVIQTINIISLKSQNDNMREKLEELAFQVDERMAEIESGIDDTNAESSGNMQSRNIDITYKIAYMDWENEKMEVFFKVQLPEANDDKQVLVNNTKEEVTLTRNGNIYTGIIDYPIDERMYATKLWVQQGEQSDFYMCEDIGAAIWASQTVKYEFDGFVSYGNGRITGVGELSYSIDIDEEIMFVDYSLGTSGVSIYSSYNDEIERYRYADLNEDGSSGRWEITASDDIMELEVEDRVLYHNTLRIDITTKSGIAYAIYPYMYAVNTYDADADSLAYLEVIEEPKLRVIFPDGRDYEFPLNISTDEFEDVLDFTY